ncbi:ATP-dependent DNA ligase [Curtobacterium sp. MCJR17_055]|jgi:hypothetical protein|uniref:DUF7882 family protein n=1 Tax=unclassified Curtobacterium TaxID=257496 RepID=UPI000D9AF4F6|nr:MULTISPECIES: ATP-dependent DNA ligase [unclassified Curtobacterium]PYY33323.1 ATP-dependent DNA ligase [Curtobacterium sp. MCBD17_029]PYY45472.1 ATP-dependent DNA ligase [Curtobacterium sp. MCBD17_023]PYY53267.1 ATP-dependent DNA ligase [Curtobacterium sp. MCJR17_055]PYY56421.1 ATP-dependent DNA ligase [Curtobacterium sp. MCPF17_015]WIB25971.1 ATP-dependent DNA ligase [Curtobacterium sp. MCSS17_015]
MGKLVYDSTFTAEFDDRLLTHLQIVIGMKLRRGESFMFSWKDDVELGDGRTAIWLDRSMPLVFRYSGSRVPAVNRAWVEALGLTAGSSAGLRIVPEPTDTGETL